MKTPNFRRMTLAAVVCLLPATLPAADRFWIDPLGGNFVDNGNWSAVSGGAGGASVPGAADDTNFDLNNTYTVSFSGNVTNNSLDVDNGNITFDLNGLTYTLLTNFGVDIGTVSNQTARLTLIDGTLNSDGTGDDIFVGLFGTGFLTVGTNGKVGTDTIRPDFNIGSNSAGTLTINDNGQVFGQTMVLASNFGTGTATVTGPQASIDLSGGVTVGSSGTGSLNVQSGGTFNTLGSLTIGSATGSEGTATITGSGSSLNAGSISIGSIGLGTLTISSGATASTTSLTQASSGVSVGNVVVTGTGSVLNLSSTHTIGGAGEASLTISAGGQLNSTSNVSIGNTGSANGMATVTGADSRWTLGSGLAVGAAGPGAVTISNGGFFSTTQNIVLGTTAPGAGTFTVTGAGSQSFCASFIVGNAGQGTFNALSGAEVYVSGNLSIFDPAGAPVGAMLLDGGSVFVSGNFQNSSAFNFVDGLLRVNGNFQAAAATGPFTLNGTDNSDLPTLELIGGGLTSNITTLNVGTNRRGELRLRQGRIVNLGANSINIASLPGGEGTLTVDSSARLLSSGTLTVGGIGFNFGGTGTLNIATGGSVDIGTLFVLGDGTVNLTGGELAFDSIGFLSGTVNWSSGTVRMDAASNTIDATFVEKFLGPANTLGPGRLLSTPVAAHTLTLTSPITLTGGMIDVSSFVNQTTLQIQAGQVRGFDTAANSGVVLLSHPLAIFDGSTISNTGTIRGTGNVRGSLINQLTGRVEALTGERLILQDPTSNAGTVSVIGGELQSNALFTNAVSTGLIAARNALLKFNGGLTNNGSVGLSFGTSDIYGDITNSATGRITVSGNSNATFYDDLVNSGVVQVSTGSTAVYFGGVSGAGSFPGGGTNMFEGDLRPGASPANIVFGGNIVLGSLANTQIEIGGLIPGTQHDQINVGGSASLNGNLELALINGFMPTPGDSFTILNAANRIGTFSSVTGTNPAPGITLTPIYLPTSVVILSSTTGDKVWGVDASGNASVGGNWVGGVAPGGIGDTAAFTTIITANRVVTLDAPLTVGTVKFDDNNNYTIAGPGTLTLQNTGMSAANISVLNAHGNGSHTINANVNALSNVNLSQGSGGILTLGGNVTLGASRTLNKTGGGAVLLTGGQTYNNNSTLSFAGGPITYNLDGMDGVALGTGVTVQLAAGTQLNLAGSNTPFSDGTDRARVFTNSPTSLLNILGINQAAGRVTGPVTIAFPNGSPTGRTDLDTRTDLTVTGLRQNRLTLAPGSPVIPTRLTVEATDGAAQGLLVLDNTTVNGGTGAPGLILGNDALIDLNDNDLVLHYEDTPADPNPLATVTGYLDNYYSFGMAPGSGVPIIGSTVVDNSGGTRVIIAVDNVNTQFGNIGNPFYDLTLGDSNLGTGFTQIIIRFTYPGDYNLDGQVDGGDYVVVDSFLGTPTPGLSGGWTLGDGDFDGMVTSADYLPIDSNFGSGVGNPLGVNLGYIGNAANPAVTAIPEPSVWLAAGLASLGVARLGLRRRR
ncbi:MAG: hypothetical protein SFX18_13055 [Pirellulales bacterium]|nr:hypothetical protein [Pirellulales bacterium]